VAAAVALDARGEALMEVPLNDSLTSFRWWRWPMPACSSFGTGRPRIRVTQDLQLLSGLPPLVRDGDRFSALLTLRNTTPREMKLRATLQGTAHSGPAGDRRARRSPLPPQDLVLPPAPQRSCSGRWTCRPASTAWPGNRRRRTGRAGARRTALKLTQLVAAAVPLRVLQATLQQLDGRISLPVAAPADALPAAGPKRGGLVVGCSPG
jgi:hypothetical protein